MSESLKVCRCEEVQQLEIEEAIRSGARSLDEIKRATRAGMGLCQGITCRRLVTRILAEKTGRSVAEVCRSSYRPPVRPIRLAVLATGEDGTTQDDHDPDG